MMSCRLFLALIVVGISLQHVYGQKIAQILEKIDAEKDSGTLSELYFKLGKQYFANTVYIKARDNFSISLSLDTLKENQKLLSYYYISKCYLEIGNYDSANTFAQQFLSLSKNKQEFEAQKDDLLSSLVYLGIKENQYDQTLSYLGLMLATSAVKKDTLQTVKTQNFIGYCLTQIGKADEAIQILNGSLLLSANSEKYVFLTINTHINKGMAYTKADDLKAAENSFTSALQLALSTKNPSLISNSRNYLSSIKYLTNHSFDAIVEAERALNLAMSVSDRNNIINAYKNLVAIYNDLDNYQMANYYEKKLRELLDIIKSENTEEEKAFLRRQIESEKQEAEIKELLAKNRNEASERIQSEMERKRQMQDLKLKDQELELLRKQRELQDITVRASMLEKQKLEQVLAAEKTQNELERQRILTLAAKNEAEKLELQAKSDRKAKETLEKEKKYSEEQRLLQNENIKFSNRILFLTVLVALLFLVFLIVVYINLKRFKQLNAQLSDKNQQIAVQNDELISQKNAIETINRQLKFKNESITSSLIYASRIQTALLPTAFSTDGIESFIVYRPKDIVSGDFYWSEKIDDIVFMAIADCTGHGVPGAMMSMLGISLLNSIVFDKKVREPNQILSILNIEVISTLEQQNSVSSDGMDILLIAWDKSKREIRFAASKINLIYFSNGQMFEIAADRFPIGFSKEGESRVFQSHKLNTDQIDILYLTTDGFKDQFGGEKNQKFGKRLFTELLNQVHRLPLADQKNIFEFRLDEWKKNNSQTDDITLIGLIFDNYSRRRFYSTDQRYNLFA